jgi:hypothetical protein
MNNFLEKWLADGSSPSASGQPRATRDDVLAMLREDRAAASAEMFDQMCVCAVHDRPFITRYTKQPSGKYRATECIKFATSSNSSRKRAGKAFKLSVDELEDGYPPCPWCGCNSNVHYHCRCGGVVCGGRVKHQVFRCRASCGAEWIPGPNAKNIEGTSAKHESKDWKWTATASKPVDENRRLLPRK